MRIIVCDQNKEKTERLLKALETYLEGPEDETGSESAYRHIQLLESSEHLLFELSDEPDEADVIITDTYFEGKTDGISAVKQLRDIGYTGEVIFLTDDKDSVFRSFEVRPANYLIKDETEPDEFVKIVADAMEYARKRKRDMLTFACAGEIKNIAVEDILYFEISQRIAEVHYKEEVFEFYSTMSKLENQLYGKGFVRTHRAFLVNSAHISYLRGDELVLDNEEAVPLSQKHAKELNLVMENE